MPSLPDDKSYVKVTSFRGTRGYMADEYLDGELSTKLDVYSLGVVSLHEVYYLLTLSACTRVTVYLYCVSEYYQASYCIPCFVSPWQSAVL